MSHPNRETPLRLERNNKVLQGMLATCKLMNKPRIACLPAMAKPIGSDSLAKGIKLFIENHTDKIPVQPMGRCP